MKRYVSVIIAMLSFAFVNAQVAVRNEPRHHNIFENEYVRILDVHLGPGDTTQLHIHATPSVFITFTKTTTGSQIIGQQPSSGTSVAGSINYDNLSTARVHRVWNEDEDWYHVQDVELVAANPKSNESPLKNSSVTQLFDELLARGYRLEMKPNETFVLPSSQVGYLLISLNDANVILNADNETENRRMKAGHYEWIAAGEKLSVSTNNNVASFALLQLK